MPILKINYLIILLLGSSIIFSSCKTDNNKSKVLDKGTDVVADSVLQEDTIVTKLDAFAEEVEASIDRYTKDSTTVGQCATIYFEKGENKIIHKIKTTCITEEQKTNWNYYQLGNQYQLVEYKEERAGSTRYRKIYLVNEPEESRIEFYKVVDENGDRPQGEKLEDWMTMVEGGLSSQ